MMVLSAEDRAAGGKNDCDNLNQPIDIKSCFFKLHLFISNNRYFKVFPGSAQEDRLVLA
jgi:hypothetical protein